MHKDSFEAKHNRAIKYHLLNLVDNSEFNRFVTITFARSPYGPLRRKNITDVRRMAQAYAKKISDTVYGRGRRFKTPRVKFIAWPEDKNKFGETVPLHIHIVCAVPSTILNSFDELTSSFWNKFANKEPHKCTPNIDIKNTYDAFGCANYSMKNIETDFTIEEMVIAGFEIH